MPVDFRYVPTSGNLSGQSLEAQTARALNELGVLIDESDTLACQAAEIATAAQAIAINAENAVSTAVTAANTATAAANEAGNVAGIATSTAAEAVELAKRAMDASALADSRSMQAENDAYMALETTNDIHSMQRTVLQAQTDAQAAQARADAAERVATVYRLTNVEGLDANTLTAPDRIYFSTEGTANLPETTGYLDIYVTDEPMAARHLIQTFHSVDGARLFARVGANSTEINEDESETIGVIWTPWRTVSADIATFAPLEHQHHNADILDLDASKITTGVIDIARLPAAAIPHIVNVADDTVRFALTSDTVTVGDTVCVVSTGFMYLVVNVSSLNSETGYQPYTAGRASTVPWSGVENKPAAVEALVTTGNAATATKLATARTFAISGGATGTATSFDGSGNVTIPVTALDVNKATAGTLPVARGGTGEITAAGALDRLGALPVAGGTVTGKLTVNNEIQGVSRYAFRQIYGDYGTYWHRDTSVLYLMITDAGNQYGSYNAFRPLRVDLTTGTASISGNAATATTATKLATGRTISLTGDVSGSASFDGSANVNITATVAASMPKRQVITASGAFTPTVTGWYRVTCIGGGGAGGGAIWRGGLAGGDTSFGSVKARGGGGGGGCGISATYVSSGGAGGGAAGEVVTGFLKLTSGTAVTVTIGAGGLASITDGTSSTGYNAGANIPHSSAYIGGLGASGASSGSSGLYGDGYYRGGNGGNGGSNGTGYGGGGGGCGGAGQNSLCQGVYGRGADNGKNGDKGPATIITGTANGGAGGPGAVILEWEA